MRQAFESVFNVYDNTTASSVKLIGYKKGRKNNVGLGDLVLVVPKKFKTSKEIQKRKKYIGLVVGLKIKKKRKSGVCVASCDNRILLLNFQNKFLGTRVYGGICKEARGGSKENTFKKIISYSSGSY